MLTLSRREAIVPVFAGCQAGRLTSLSSSPANMRGATHRQAAAASLILHANACTCQGFGRCNVCCTTCAIQWCVVAGRINASRGGGGCVGWGRKQVQEGLSIPSATPSHVYNETRQARAVWQTEVFLWATPLLERPLLLRKYAACIQCTALRRVASRFKR